MNLNHELKAILREHNIDYTNGMLCLFSIYYEIPLEGDIGEILDETMQQLSVSKIVEKDYKNSVVKWNVPLFQQQDTNWNWVQTEYRPLFTSVNKLRGGSAGACVKRMQDFFKKHPDVRKDDVLEATRAYIRTVDDSAYLQSADYFILKGVGATATSKLEQFIEIQREKKQLKSDFKMMK